MRLTMSTLHARSGWINLAGGMVALAMLLLSACSPAATAVPQPATAIPLRAAPTPPTPATAQPRASPTPPSAATAEPTATPAPPTAEPTPTAGVPAALPLSELGPYYPGRRTFTAVDESRGGREVSISVWFPALLPAGVTGSNLLKLFAGNERAPDRSGAPYPLILSSTAMASTIAPYLVTRGFIWASVDGIDSYAKMSEQMYSQPLDILFALDQVASHPPEELQGMINSDHAGAIGYSFDGYNTLAMSGARIDPAHYRAQCPKPDPTTEPLVREGMSAYSCGPAEDWEAFSARAGEAITASQDGLWQAMTDPRIRAVMPMACEGWWLFGEKGLAAVDRPTLMLVATNDELYRENVLIFDHLGTPEKALISIIGPSHVQMVMQPELHARMGHFAAAFFGYHLLGRAEYAHYFSQEFVAQQPALAWGAYEGM